MEKPSWLSSQLGGDGTTEECSERCNIAGFEDRIRGPQAKEYRQALVAGKSKDCGLY